MQKPQSVSAAVKWIAARAGLDVRRRSHDPAAQLVRLLGHHEVDLVLDVGAHVGGFARGLFQFGYSGDVVSFEPSSLAFNALETAASASGKPWHAVRAALGDRSGSVRLNIAGNSGASSSILPMEPLHAEVAPTSRYVDSEEVPLITIDSFIESMPMPVVTPFLKIDVQGYEEAVLAGAERTLESCVGVQLEISLAPLYKGGLDHLRAFRLMDDRGLTPGWIAPAFVDAHSGRCLQVDVAFFRR